MTGRAFTLATVVNSACLPLVVWAADSAGINPPRPLEALAASGLAAVVYAFAHGGVREVLRNLWTGWQR